MIPLVIPKRLLALYPPLFLFSTDEGSSVVLPGRSATLLRPDARFPFPVSLGNAQCFPNPSGGFKWQCNLL